MASFYVTQDRLRSALYTLQNATSTDFTPKHTIFQKTGGKAIDPKIIFKSNIKNIKIFVNFEFSTC
jgi:hypothetical protein